jgi:hypothetical protein
VIKRVVVGDEAGDYIQLGDNSVDLKVRAMWRYFGPVVVSLFEDEFNALWQTADRSVGDRISLLRQCPQGLGRGYERFIRLQNIELLIVNEQFHQDVWIETAPFNTIDCVEFGFNLSSTENNIQESFLQWTTADDL